MSQNVFFRRVRKNEDTGTATIICASTPVTLKSGKLAGLDVATSSQAQTTIGVLSLRDKKTGDVMGAKHPTILALEQKLNAGDEMPGFRLSDNPGLDRETGEPTGLFWVEQY